VLELLGKSSTYGETRLRARAQHHWGGPLGRSSVWDAVVVFDDERQKDFQLHSQPSYMLAYTVLF
jgi:hypothetical protein